MKARATGGRLGARHEPDLMRCSLDLGLLCHRDAPFYGEIIGSSIATDFSAGRIWTGHTSDV